MVRGSVQVCQARGAGGMSHSARIPKVRTECIPYIEGCGWRFTHRSSFGTYCFKGLDGRKTMSGSETVGFSLTEIRFAFLNGW